MYYVSRVMAPDTIFAHDLPVMLEMWQTWKTSDAVYQQRMNEAIANMNEAHRLFEEAMEYRERVSEKCSASFDEVVRGYGMVQHTPTGTRSEITLIQMDQFLLMHPDWVRVPPGEY
jgi:hypothetical protein